MAKSTDAPSEEFTTPLSSNLRSRDVAAQQDSSLPHPWSLASNVELRRRIGQPSILRSINQRRILWLGHVLRRPDNHPIEVIYRPTNCKLNTNTRWTTQPLEGRCPSGGLTLICRWLMFSTLSSPWELEGQVGLRRINAVMILGIVFVMSDR